MLVIDVGDKYVGDNFEMLVTDLRFWWRIKYIKNHQHIEKIKKFTSNFSIDNDYSDLSHEEAHNHDKDFHLLLQFDFRDI